MESSSSLVGLSFIFFFFLSWYFPSRLLGGSSPVSSSGDSSKINCQGAFTTISPSFACFVPVPSSVLRCVSFSFLHLEAALFGHKVIPGSCIPFFNLTLGPSGFRLLIVRMKVHGELAEDHPPSPTPLASFTSLKAPLAQSVFRLGSPQAPLALGFLVVRPLSPPLVSPYRGCDLDELFCVDLT